MFILNKDIFFWSPSFWRFVSFYSFLFLTLRNDSHQKGNEYTFIPALIWDKLLSLQIFKPLFLVFFHFLERLDIFHFSLSLLLSFLLTFFLFSCFLLPFFLSFLFSFFLLSLSLSALFPSFLSSVPSFLPLHMFYFIPVTNR